MNVLLVIYFSVKLIGHWIVVRTMSHFKYRHELWYSRLKKSERASASPYTHTLYKLSLKQLLHLYSYKERNLAYCHVLIARCCCLHFIIIFGIWLCQLIMTTLCFAALILLLLIIPLVVFWCVLMRQTLCVRMISLKWDFQYWLCKTNEFAQHNTKVQLCKWSGKFIKYTAQHDMLTSRKKFIFVRPHVKLNKCIPRAKILMSRNVETYE